MKRFFLTALSAVLLSTVLMSSLYPDPDDCTAYTNDAGMSFSCSNGLYFNPETQMCDFPENVSCDAGDASGTKKLSTTLEAGFTTASNWSAGFNLLTGGTFSVTSGQPVFFCYYKCGKIYTGNVCTDKMMTKANNSGVDCTK